MRRLVLFGFIAAVPPWVLLAVLAGNEGLQRSISKGAWTLITERPHVGLAVAMATLALAWVAAPLLGGRTSLLAPIAVLAWNLVAGLILAPIAIGELEPVHAPLVVAATTVCGLTLVAAWAGARLRRRSRRALGLTGPMLAADDAEPPESEAPG